MNDTIANASIQELSSWEFAQKLDAQDPLAKFRDEFAIPPRRSVSGSHPVVGMFITNRLFFFTDMGVNRIRC